MTITNKPTRQSAQGWTFSGAMILLDSKTPELATANQNDFPPYRFYPCELSAEQIKAVMREMADSEDKDH